MMIVWSLIGRDRHPTLWPIFTKLYRAHPVSASELNECVSYTISFNSRPGLIAEIAPAGTKLKPGARILRTIA
jgi:hypothetical protein